MNPVVFITEECPYPSNTGGKIRDAFLISLLSEQAPVEVLCFDSSQAGVRARGEVPPSVQITFLKRERDSFLDEAFARVRPPVAQGYSRVMADAIRTRAGKGAGRRKLLWASRLGMAKYIPIARSLGYTTILDEHKVESLELFEQAYSSVRQWPKALLAAQCSRYEEKLCSAADMVVTSSEINASRLHKLAPQVPIYVIPNSVDGKAYSKSRTQAGETLLFSGTLNQPANIQGLTWFCDEVLPRLKAALQGKLPRIVVAGANPSPELTRMLEEAGVEVRANPSSTLPLLRQAAIVFVPIRSSGGTRFKILEAMAAGRAIVSTGRGAEGLVLAPTHDIWIADQADGFTSAILRLLRNPELRQQIGANAARTIERNYDWECTRPLLEQLLSKLEAKRPTAPAQVPASL